MCDVSVISYSNCRLKVSFKQNCRQLSIMSNVMQCLSHIFVKLLFKCSIQAKLKSSKNVYCFFPPNTKVSSIHFYCLELNVFIYFHPFWRRNRASEELISVEIFNRGKIIIYVCPPPFPTLTPPPYPVRQKSKAPIRVVKVYISSFYCCKRELHISCFAGTRTEFLYL